MNTFKLKQIVRIAKIIRDAPMHIACKASLINRLHDLFLEDNPAMDSKRFLGIATGKLNDEEINNFLKLRKISL